MHFPHPAPGWLTPRLAPTSLATVIIGFLVAGCHDGNVPSEPGSIIPPLSVKDKGCPGSEHPSCKTEPGNAKTFLVSISRSTDQWAAPQQLQSADKVDWLHVFDSGGKGTRGNPNYANAAFLTSISLKPTTTPFGSCVGGGPSSLFDKLDQGLNTVVFDFQTDYDIGDPGQANGPSFFIFRWEEAGGKVFSAEIGFYNATQGHPSIDFLGDNDGGTDDIRDPTIARVFRITGGTVIAKELRRNRVLATVACKNDQFVDVTVAPLP